MITIGFSSHHAEALPFARKEMERHQIIVLEEPSSPNFSAMLEGTLSIHDYLMDIDEGFPEFDRLMCGLLQGLHAKGLEIIQVEPYLENLLQIHGLFAKGKTPEEVVKVPALKEVYGAEKRATRALITYYRRTMNEPFEKVIEAVKYFARVDAERLTLRARLRARVIAPITKTGKGTYIEAGYIHYPFYLYLRRELGPGKKIRVVYLLEPMIKRLKGRRRNLGPGDILTLRYALHSGLQEDLESLLAARSLIYIKLINKDELLPGHVEAPHSEDEVKVSRLVDHLGFEDCKEIFRQIRFENRVRALSFVKDYMLGKGL